MKDLLFIYNPKSGTGLIKNWLSDIIDIFVKAGFIVTVYPTQERGDATEKTLLAMEGGRTFDRVVCSGGDGTLDEVVTGMMQSEKKVPIGYIPTGSTNDFGSSLGLDKGMIKAAQAAAGDKLFPLDIGAFNEDSFVYVAAFGAFTEVSYQTPQDLKNMLGHAAYIIEGAKSIFDLKSYKMQVEISGEVVYGEFIYGMVTNSNSVGGFKGLIGGDVSLNDGLFEVTLIKMPRNPIEFSEILAVLAGTIPDSQLVLTYRTWHIKFTSEEEVPWTLDGEYGGTHSIVTVENKAKALEICIE